MALARNDLVSQENPFFVESIFTSVQNETYIHKYHGLTKDGRY